MKVRRKLAGAVVAAVSGLALFWAPATADPNMPDPNIPDPFADATPTERDFLGELDRLGINGRLGPPQALHEAGYVCLSFDHGIPIDRQLEDYGGSESGAQFIEIATRYICPEHIWRLDAPPPVQAPDEIVIPVG